MSQMVEYNCQEKSTRRLLMDIVTLTLNNRQRFLKYYHKQIGEKGVAKLLYASGTIPVEIRFMCGRTDRTGHWKISQIEA